MNIGIPADQVLLYGIAIAAVLIYLPFMAVAIGRIKAGLDLEAPRAMFDKLPDYAKRGVWAHQNAFEIFPIFTAAAVMVYITGKSSEYTTAVVVAFLLARFAYGAFYIANIPLLRSLMWAINVFCVASLMFTSFK